MMTRYGAQLSTPQQAAAVLRARAAGQGVALDGASETDLVAAAIGADAWCALLGCDTLTRPAAQGEAACAVLAAILARSAGGAVRSLRRTSVFDLCSDAPARHLLPEAENHARWAFEVLSAEQGRRALRRVAADMRAGGEDERFGAAALIYDALADQGPASL